MNSQELRNLQEAYLDVYRELDEKQEMQGSLLTRRGTAQNFTGNRNPFTVAEPIKQGQRSSVSFPSPNSQTQSPGQLNIPGTSQITSSGGAPGPRPGQTIRATGPTGNFPQLNRYVNNPSIQKMQSVSKLSTLARAGKGGVLGLLLEPTPTSSTDTPGTAPGVSRYNTRDASGRIRNRLVVGQGKVGQGKVGSVSQSFDKEYAKQKSSGAKEFSFKGKQYTTDSYEPDLFDVILEHLITKGYADTNESALAIMGNMSEDWKDDILEARVDDGLSDEEKQDVRNKRSGNSTFTRRNLTRASRNKSPKGLKPSEPTQASMSMAKYTMALNQPGTPAGKRVRGDIEMNNAERGSGRRGS